MARVLILGGAVKTDPARRALVAAGHDVQVYWSRPNDGTRDGAQAPSLRSGVAWAQGLLDTTHPFDASLRAFAHNLAMDLPALRLARPLWQPQFEDTWHPVATLPSGLAALPPKARVFAATGRDSADLLGHHDGPVFLRQLQRHTDAAPPNCTFVFGTGPFDIAGEIALFRELNIDVLMARNVGGRGSFPKVEAARALGLPVVMLTPDASPFGPPVHDTPEVTLWAERL